MYNYYFDITNRRYTDSNRAYLYPPTLAVKITLSTKAGGYIRDTSTSKRFDERIARMDIESVYYVIGAFIEYVSDPYIMRYRLYYDTSITSSTPFSGAVRGYI